MSRLRQTDATRKAAAQDAFRLEVKLQRTRFNMTQGELANRADMNQAVLSKCLKDPGKLSVERLGKIAQALELDPLTILALLGYGPREIQNLGKDN